MLAPLTKHAILRTSLFIIKNIMQSLLINRPDDWHVHVRDGEALIHTVPATARHFFRALIMPNLKPALTTIDMLIAYRKRILSVLPQTSSFNPLMTFYLNEEVSVESLLLCREYPFIVGGKLYPAGATTNSAEGVSSIQRLFPLFDVMQEQDLVLQVHGETTQGDIFFRESSFIHKHLIPIVQNFPKLRIVLEHISTRSAVDFVENSPPTVAATITPHHLLYNRNHLLAGGLHPHYYCLPILKKKSDQQALLNAAVSGNPKFFAGTDSAPHAREQKENACGCAGIYSAPYAVALYAQIFDELNQLPQLNAFLSRFGASFYRQPWTNDQLLLSKTAQMVPRVLPFGTKEVVPIAAGSCLPWSIDETH